MRTSASYLVLWAMIAIVAIFVVHAIGSAFDNYAERVSPSCSQGVCAAPIDQTP